MMRITYRIPTEQYGYVEIEDDVAEGFFEPEKLLAQYEGFKELFTTKQGEGIDPKEFNQALDTFLSNGTGSTEVWSRMSKAQQEVFQCIKRSMKRIEAKNGKEKDDEYLDVRRRYRDIPDGNGVV